jgi:hypothetical protein
VKKSFDVCFLDVSCHLLISHGVSVRAYKVLCQPDIAVDKAPSQQITSLTLIEAFSALDVEISSALVATFVLLKNCFWLGNRGIQKLFTCPVPRSERAQTPTEASMIDALVTGAFSDINLT